MTELHAAFMMQREEWMSEGACRGADPNIFVLDQGYTGAQAASYCRRCNVTVECENYARRTNSVGVFGGKLFTFRYSDPVELLPPVRMFQDARPVRITMPHGGNGPSIIGSPIQIGRPSILGR